jgi:hypothetical protein
MGTFNEDFDADIVSSSVFYDTGGGFAVTASGSSGAFPVIFDKDYESFEGDHGTMTTANPQAWCRDGDVPSLNSNVTINSVSYKVLTTQPNDQGETLLILGRNA